MSHPPCPTKYVFPLYVHFVCVCALSPPRHECYVRMRHVGVFTVSESLYVASDSFFNFSFWGPLAFTMLLASHTHPTWFASGACQITQRDAKEKKTITIVFSLFFVVFHDVLCFCTLHSCRLRLFCVRLPRSYHGTQAAHLFRSYTDVVCAGHLFVLCTRVRSALGPCGCWLLLIK